ncbi:unnamed protein product [Boreogadus saida]
MFVLQFMALRSTTITSAALLTALRHQNLQLTSLLHKNLKGAERIGSQRCGREGAVCPAQFRGRVSTADSTLGEHIDPTTSSPPPLAVFWTPEVTGVIKGGIVVVIAMVIAAVCCRKKISSWLERFKGACSSKNHKAEVEKMEDQRLYRC